MLQINTAVVLRIVRVRVLCCMLTGTDRFRGKLRLLCDTRCGGECRGVGGAFGWTSTYTTMNEIIRATFSCRCSHYHPPQPPWHSALTSNFGFTLPVQQQQTKKTNQRSLNDSSSSSSPPIIRLTRRSFGRKYVVLLLLVPYHCKHYLYVHSKCTS